MNGIPEQNASLFFDRDCIAGFISMASDSIQAKKDKLDPSQIIYDCEYSGSSMWS
jgi:hypothetical protein